MCAKEIGGKINSHNQVILCVPGLPDELRRETICCKTALVGHSILKPCLVKTGPKYGCRNLKRCGSREQIGKARCEIAKKHEESVDRKIKTQHRWSQNHGMCWK